MDLMATPSNYYVYNNAQTDILEIIFLKNVNLAAQILSSKI